MVINTLQYDARYTRQIIQRSNFMKIHPLVAEFCMQTDRLAEVNGRFSHHFATRQLQINPHGADPLLRARLKCSSATQAIHADRTFITVFTTALGLLLWTRRIQPTSSLPRSLRSILMWPTSPALPKELNVPRGLFPYQNSKSTSRLSPYAPHPLTHPHISTHKISSQCLFQYPVTLPHPTDHPPSPAPHSQAPTEPDVRCFSSTQNRQYRRVIHFDLPALYIYNLRPETPQAFPTLKHVFIFFFSRTPLSLFSAVSSIWTAPATGCAAALRSVHELWPTTTVTSLLATNTASIRLSSRCVRFHPPRINITCVDQKTVCRLSTQSVSLFSDFPTCTFYGTADNHHLYFDTIAEHNEDGNSRNRTAHSS